MNIVIGSFNLPHTYDFSSTISLFLSSVSDSVLCFRCAERCIHTVQLCLPCPHCPLPSFYVPLFLPSSTGLLLTFCLPIPLLCFNLLPVPSQLLSFFSLPLSFGDTCHILVSHATNRSSSEAQEENYIDITDMHSVFRYEDTKLIYSPPRSHIQISWILGRMLITFLLIKTYFMYFHILCLPSLLAILLLREESDPGFLIPFF